MFVRYLSNASRFAIRMLALCYVACPLLAIAADDELGIFVMNVDTGEEHKVAQIATFPKHWTPRWSHDGKRLAFSVHGGQNNASRVYLVDPDGKNLKEIGEGSAPDWSPDDLQLIVQNTTGNARRGLWLHDLSKGTRNWVCEGTCPRWSGDGNRIAYRSGDGIRYLDLSTNEDRLLIDAARIRCMDGMEWAHDSQRLGFFGKPPEDTSNAFYIVDVTATPVRPILRYKQPGFIGGHLSWSPNDKQIVFTIESFMHVLDVSGDDPPQRLPGQPSKSRDPNWSPDGKSIAFARRKFP